MLGAGNRLYILSCVDKVCPGQPGAQRPNNQHAAFSLDHKQNIDFFYMLSGFILRTFSSLMAQVGEGGAGGGGGGGVGKPKASVSDGQYCCLSWNVLTC